MDVSRTHLDPRRVGALAAAAAVGLALIVPSAHAQLGDEYWWDGFRLPGTSTGVLDYAEWNGLTVMVGGFYGANDDPFLRVTGWNGSTFEDVGGGIGCTDVFVPCVTEDALAVVVFEDDLVVAGRLSEVDGTAISNVARYDGTSWTPMGTGFNGAIHALAVHDGVLYAGGAFTAVSGAATMRLARWDGSDWVPFATGPDHDVNALVSVDGELVVAGEFENVDGIPAGRVAAYDGLTWRAIGLGFDDEVRVLHVDTQGLIWAGGDFTTVEGYFSRGVARWTDETWVGIGTGVVGRVYDITSYRSSVVIGGEFTSINGLPVNNLAGFDSFAFDLGGGTGGRVESVHSDGDLLFVSGSFGRVGDVKVANIGAWNGETWQTLGPPTGQGLDARAHAAEVHEGRLIVGGDFQLAGNDPTAAYVAAWNGTTFEPMGGLINDSVYALHSVGGDLYAGGIFRGIPARAGSGVASDAVAVWDEGRLEWQGLNFGFPGDTEVNVLHDYDGQLVAGGRFQTSGFTTVRNLGTWNGFSWEEIGSGIEGTAPEVLALTTFEGDLIVGGDFDLAGGSAVSNIARWNGSTWDDMGSELTGDVLALAVVDGILYAGGRFLRATGSPADYLARWTGSFWEAIPEPVDGSVQTLSIFENQLLVSGNFGRGGTSIVHRMGIWTGTAWETLGSGLQTPADDVAVFRGDLYVAGPFTRIGEGRTSAYLARWQDPTPDIETHVVTSLDDLNDANPGDGICADETGQCTLRAALEEANVSTGIDTVRFDLASPGPWQIIPFSNYPRLAEGVVIDATTLDGYAGAPLLELRGSSIDGSITAFAVDGRDSRIEGIAFTGWGEDALELAGTGGHRIVDCYVGVGTSGTLTDANVNGISILSPDNRIEGCTISGQGDGYGVRIVDESADRTTIVDCLIGLSPDGSTAIPNRDGILVSSGDDTRITATTISGNTDHGVQLTGGAQRTRITASTLGLDAAGGSAPNGGHGILVLDASETWIGGLLAADANQIAFNGGAGVALPFNKGPDASGTRILRNRIYGNGGLGIDLGELGVDDADPLDADTGPNDLQNAPQLEALTFHPDHTVVSGLLLGMPGERYTIEVFSSSSCDPSGSGEAERFEGRGVVTADDLGDAPFHVYLPSPLTEGEVLSATATSSAGNTSELAACLIVDAPVVEEPQVFLAQAETVPVDRYFLVGLPAYPQTGTPPVATLIGGFGDYDPDRWRVFGIVDEPEREYAENPPALRGQACFLLTTEASDLTVTGIPYRWPGAVRLVPGWNGISARPDGFEWGDCQVVLDDARAFAFGTAGADRVLASQVSWYDDVTGDLVNDGDWRTASADTTTGLWTGLPDNPFWGYVFFAREACTLVFPDAPERRSQGRPSPPPGSTLPIGASGAPRPSEAWGVSGEPGASGVSSAPASGLGLSSPLTWALTLDIEGGNGVAVGVAASDASPGWTVLRPPFVDTATTSLRLEDAPMLLADYRPAGGGPETWTVDVRSSSDTAVLTVPSRRIPSGWSAWIEDEGGHVLVDLTAHDRVEVATPPSGRRLSVIVSPVGPGVGPVRPATSGIRALRPSPVRDRAVVTVELARAGRVSLDVFDVQGRRLEPVWSGWLDAGRHDLTWRVGNGSEGRAVSGVVFLRLTGPSADAARKVLVVGASD